MPALPETQLERRGHLFYPPVAVKIPALGRSGVGPTDEKTVHVHYFVGGGDWWLTEYDRKTGEAFGYACLNGDWQNAEWGYVSLPELEAARGGPPLYVVVERDCYWTPQTFAQVMAGRR